MSLSLSCGHSGKSQSGHAFICTSGYHSGRGHAPFSLMRRVDFGVGPIGVARSVFLSSAAGSLGHSMQPRAHPSGRLDSEENVRGRVNQRFSPVHSDIQSSGTYKQ